MVDDGLGVSDVGGCRVLEEPTLQHHHHLGTVGVAECMDAGIVVAGQHEDLVRAAGFGLDVHRAEVVHGERLVTIERRVQIRDHPHLPLTALVDGVERRKGVFLVARTERARTTRVGLDLGDAGREVGRSLSTLGHDRDPPPGEWIETQLTHSAPQLRTSGSLLDGRDGDLCHTR
jgi:hypothetical protein